MATKSQIAQAKISAIDEAASNALNMKPPTLEDMYEHALGVKLGESTKAQMRKERRKADAKINALFKQLETIEPIPIQIAKAIQTAQDNSKSDKRERAPGVTDKWIAQQFNNYALPLIAKCYPINKEGDEERIRRDIIPTLRKQMRKFAMNKEYGGLCVYEKMRGGNKSGYATVGSITERQIKRWINAYTDKSNPEPKSGFHAGMLKDKTSIEEAARKWGNYWRGYALAFFDWRKTHTGTPRNQFRYSPPPVIHGAEHTAASAPRS